MLTEGQKAAAFNAGAVIGRVNRHLGENSGLVAAHTFANEFDGVDTNEQRIARIFHFARGWEWGFTTPDLDK